MVVNCTNCIWKGEESELKQPHNHCPNCGATVQVKEEVGRVETVSTRDSFDLNNDGVVDSKDRSLAAKVLAGARNKKRGKR